MNKPNLTDTTAVAIFASVTVILSFAVYLLPVTRAALPFLIVLIPAVVVSALTAMREGQVGAVAHQPQGVCCRPAPGPGNT